MFLTRHQFPNGPRWARDGRLLPHGFTLADLLELPRSIGIDYVSILPTSSTAESPLLAPIEPLQEVWAGGVTYHRSLEGRMAESRTDDIYARIYHAERPELFFKAIGWRCAGNGHPIRVRPDSDWNVPEPELVLVFNRDMEVVGYCVGNDVSSRAIEGENPLYLPQAKMFDGCCAIGPGIVIAEADKLTDMTISMRIFRGDAIVYQDEISTSAMERTFGDLLSALGADLAFPVGGMLMTGTGLVPPEAFTLKPGDEVEISVGEQTLRNPVRD